MTHRFGETSEERLRYRTPAAMAVERKQWRGPVRERSDMGETRVVSYQPSTIKPRLREVSDAIREHRTPELIAERDAILLEAEAAGWTPQEMRGACRFASVNNVHTRLHHLHALQSAGGSPTTG